MWARVARTLRRMALLVSLGLTALALLLLPRPSLRVISLKSIVPATIGPPPTDDVYINVSKGAKKANESEEQAIGVLPMRQRLWFLSGGQLRPDPDNNPRWNPMDEKLFPEEAPGEDRIVNQLMFAIPKTKDVPIKTILLANGYSTWHVSPGRSEFLRNQCPVDRCTVTANSDYAATADAILFKDYMKYFDAVRPLKQLWILYYLECPYHTPSLRSPLNLINLTATYRRDSDIVTPYERWVYYDPKVTARDVERNYAAHKTKKVAWFVSNCHARNNRLQYARALSKHIQVDIYGACGTHSCPRSDPFCLQMLDKDYKFYLAFENSNCRDYITEKFFVNGLSHDSLPIVMGARASEYAAAAPHNSYLHVDEFASPEELAHYLHRLDQDDDLYNSYFRWKGTGQFINTFFFCRLCAMIHASDLKHRSSFYKDVQSWWKDEACTKGEWRNPVS